MSVACKGSGKGSDAPCEVEDAPWKLQVMVQPTPRMNLDDTGKPLDTRLRIYQLAGTSSLAGLELVELWQDSEALLGTDFVAMEEHTVFINRPFDLTIEPDPKASHILAVALLRLPLGQSFMQSVPLPLDYGKGLCPKDAAALLDPCFFVAVDENQVLAGFTPPPNFDRTAIARECPSPAKLNAPPPPPPSEDDKKKKRKRWRDRGKDAKEGADKAKDGADKASKGADAAQQGSDAAKNAPGDARSKLPSAPK